MPNYLDRLLKTPETYTPIATPGHNVTNVTPYIAKIFKSGDNVLVSSLALVTPIASGQQSSFTLTLPISTAKASVSGHFNGEAGQQGFIISDNVDGVKASFNFVSVKNTPINICYTFTYTL